MAKKSFKTNNLVIICEGTETEYPYFEFLANKVRGQFDDIKVIISPEEKRALDNQRASQNRRKRNLALENFFYVLKEENEGDIEANYELYKQAPAKYVREAYLWVKNEEYSEAWAVYDLDDTDDKDHSKHRRANDLICNNPSLHKAFSAYSFEEWLLLNFERCNIAFDHSAYKEKKTGRECKGRHCQYEKCKTGCIGDYLTSKGYAEFISANFTNDDSKKKDDGYSKNDGRSYAKAIYEDEMLRHRAYVNAAWSRSIKKGELFFDCNPYSDVDKLIMRLMNEEKEIDWIKTNENFTLGVNTFTIEQKDGSLSLSHQGDEPYMLNKNQIFWCDDDYNKKAEAISDHNINNYDCNNEAKPLVTLDNCNILCIKDGNQEFYFEYQRESQKDTDYNNEVTNS